MLSIPEDIKALFRKDNRTKETERHLKLYFFEEEINLLFPEDSLFPSDEIFPTDMNPYYVIEDVQIVSESMTITESLCESEDLKFGECNATQFEITVADVFQDLTGMEFLATIEIGGYELALGTYKVESFVRQADRRRKKITAYNRMRKFQVDVAEWYQGLDFPLSLKGFRDSLCDYVDIKQINQSLPLDDMTISKTIEPEQISGIDVIQSICEINGCFGQVDRTGRLKYVFLEHTGLFPSEKLFPEDDLFPADALDGDSELISHYKQSETTYEDYVVEGIDKVRIRQEEGDVGESFPPNEVGENAYTIQGNFLVYGKSSSELSEISEIAFGKISKKIYRPCHIVSPSLPWVEVGDVLVCYTSDDVIETFCMKRTMSGCQSMMDTFESTGGKEREEDFGIQTSVLQLEGKTAVIKKSVEEVSVRLTDLKAQEEAHFEITSNRITAEVKRAQEAEAALKIEADRISLDVTNFKKDTNARFELTDEAIKTKVTRGTISSEISQEAGKITLSANRLIVNSTNFKLDGDGNATFSGNVTGANITGSTITGGTITGTSIYGGTNIRFQARPGVIQVGDFYVDDEYGRQIFQSEDECTGMSTGDVPTGKWYLWAGYGKASGGPAVFLVSRGQVRIYGDLYINDKNIMSLINSGGGGCSSDCSGDSGCSCDSKTSCTYEGCVGQTCGPGDV